MKLITTSLTSTTNGTITISDSVVTYTPDPDYCGPDSFTYNGAMMQILLLHWVVLMERLKHLPLVAMATNDDINGNVTGGGWENGEQSANSHLSPVGSPTSSRVRRWNAFISRWWGICWCFLVLHEMVFKNLFIQSLIHFK